MANRRIFFAIQSAGIAPYGTYNFIPIRGLQSAAITTNINFEKIFQLGQLALYEQAELVPEIEFTAEKCLDGNPLICHLATNGTTAGSLVGRSNQRCTIALNVFGDTQYSASGVSIAEVDMSGMYWSQSTFTFPMDGAQRESFSAVGNNKLWLDIAGGTTMNFSGFFTGADLPYALTSGSGGIQRRQDVIFWPIGAGPAGLETANTLDVNGQVAAFLTILPPDIPGISTSGTNNIGSDGQFACHVQTISVSANLGRDSIYELGRKGPYTRFVAWPVDVTTDIEITGIKWDNISATVDPSVYTTGPNAGDNTVNRTIRVRNREGTFINCGTNNRLQNTSYTGGDTGGGNVAIKYTYQTSNDLTISHPQDPSHMAWPY